MTMPHNRQNPVTPMIKSQPKLFEASEEKVNAKDYQSDASSVTPLRLRPNRLHADAYQHF